MSAVTSQPTWQMNPVTTILAIASARQGFQIYLWHDPTLSQSRLESGALDLTCG
jgi:hypothetical protein